MYLILILNSICICVSMEMCVDGILYYYEVFALSVDRSMYGHVYYVEYIKKIEYYFLVFVSLIFFLMLGVHYS